MKIIAYLAFTVLSVAIQFVVMDLIQDKIKINKNEDEDTSNVTSPQRLFKDILQQYNNNSHALYYRTPDMRLQRNVERIFNNSSLQEITLETSTDMSTMIDLLYDDNTTVTEDAFSFSSEPIFPTTTELDNVTEINIFTKTNATEKPNVIPKRNMNKDCFCNFLYKVCDINCCCDRDCTDSDLKLFKCSESALGPDSEGSLCNSPFSLNTYSVGSNIQNLLCIASNLPDKRNIIRNKHDPTILTKTFKWNTRSYASAIPEFTKSFYKYGDPIWLIKNHSIFTIDMPFATLNDYCNERIPIKILVQQKTKCNVKLSDLEMLQILNNVQETSVISVIDKTMNATVMNCSTLHCTNWSIVLCDENNCTKFDNKTHNPLCTENICTHLALKIDYMFHYYENKIMNATIKLHSTQKVPLRVPLIQQQINVDFYVTNVTAENIVEFSGNPGYIAGLPVIISFHKNNYTEKFMNETLKTKKHIVYVDNKGGLCSKSSDSKKYVLFGNNKRIKCRYNYKMTQHNETEHCKNIQRNIYKLLGFADSISVSPLGDPQGLKDSDWLSMKTDVPDGFSYGKFNEHNTKLHCYNFVNRFSMIFTFADTGEAPSKQKLKILSAKVEITPGNVTFDADDVSVVVTIDTTFIDETKASVYEYAGGPHLDIRLPSDFFFPFHANKVNSGATSSTLLLLMTSLILLNFSK